MKKRRRTHLLATRMGNPVQSHENSGLPAWELPANRMNSSVAAAICTIADVVCTNAVDNCANDDGGRSSNSRGRKFPPAWTGKHGGMRKKRNAG